MANTTQARFIAFEGIDGSGKSSQLQRLAQRLRGKGLEVHVTREPTDSPIGSLIHQHMTHRIQLNEETIAALFAADRLDHVLNAVDGIQSKLANGVTVLTDRYYFSSYAYHSLHVPMDWVIAANSLTASMLRADMTLFLDTGPLVCLKRLNEGRGDLERYENHETLEKVRERYFEAFAREEQDETIVVVDGSVDMDSVSHEVWEKVSGLFQVGEDAGA